MYALASVSSFEPNNLSRQECSMYSTLSTDCFPSQPRKEKGGFSIISFAQQASYMAASAAAASESDER